MEPREEGSGARAPKRLFSFGRRAYRRLGPRRAWLAGAVVAVLLAAVMWAATQAAPASAMTATPGEADWLAPELQPIEPLAGPFVVAIQAGHWQADELPDELSRLRASTGATSHGIREVDVNLAVARSLQTLIEARGWSAILLPSTIPPGLRADVFVAIHADWGATSSIHGWKVAAPWRPSPASLALAAAIKESFGSESSLAQDLSGVTIGMRGYYAFSYRRFVHTISPFTPSAIVELGFLTNQRERELLVDHPEYWAGILDRGIARFLSGFDRTRTADLRPMILPRLATGPAGAVVRAEPRPEGRRLWSLDAGIDVIPVDQQVGWYEVFLRDHHASGWIEADELTSRS